MKDIVVAPLAPVTTEGSLADLPGRNAAESPAGAAFARKVTGGRWMTSTWREFAADVDAVAKGLIASGVEPGSRVGLMSRTRYEWTLVDFATWSAGGVVVPIYETSSPEQVEWILSDSGAVLAVVETPAHRETVALVEGQLPDLAEVVVIADGGLDALREKGASVPDADLAARRAGLDRTSLATIIYTSGTTGRPKGCELTHGNFLDLAENATEKLTEVVRAEGASTLLFLPLAHVFARFIEVLCVSAKARMGHSSDIKTLLEDFAGFQPTFVLAVPRVFEKIYNSAEAKAAAEGKGRIFLRAATVAIAHSEALDAGGPGLLLRLQHLLFDRLVYGKLRAAMGGKVQYAVSGGAPLGTRLGHFYRGIGVIILEGYGLTETSAATHANLPERRKIGAVGPALPGIDVRIAEDGEVLMRGPWIMRGYRGLPDQTRESLDADGWLHTGDVGFVDQDGFLAITDRKKDLIKTSGGKYVAPTELESRLKAISRWVAQALVHGDRRSYVTALLTLDPEAIAGWASQNGLDGKPVAELARAPEVRALVQRDVDVLNAGLPRFATVKRFTILPREFSETEGEVTPSQKLKRKEIERRYRAQLDAMYPETGTR